MEKNGIGIETRGKSLYVLLGVSIALMLIGSAVARGGLTAFGEIRVEETDFVNENAAKIHALLYIPKSASADKLVPGIVLCHGYSASNDAQEQHAIELARRGIVAMCIDAYAHGSSGFPDMNLKSVVNDMGIYSALQYIARLPYVDKTRLGVTGHSMGADSSRYAAIRAFAEKEKNPSVAVPKAVFLQSNSFKIVKDINGDPINAFGIDYGVNFGKYDEFAIMMWGVQKGSDYKTTPQFAVGMGFEGADYGIYYNYQDPAPLSREAAITAGNKGTLRVGYTQNNSHSALTFSGKAVSTLLDFFDIALNNGEMAKTIPYSNQVWRWKNFGGGLAMLGLIMFVIVFGLCLLRLPFFDGIVKKEPPSLTTLTDAKSRIIYAVFYIIALLAPAFLYTWTSGLRIYNPFHGVLVPVKFPVTAYFSLPTLNGVVLLNLILTAFYIVLFFIIYKFLAKPTENSFESTGLKVSLGVLLKSVLLGILAFAGGYFAIGVCAFLFHVDFGFFKFLVRVMPDFKWGHYLKYLPFYFLYFLVNSVMLNSITRLNRTKEWINTILVIFANLGGLLILWLYDYIPLYTTGLRGIPTVPGEKTPNSLSGILLYGLLFILLVAAIFSRIFYKKTGNAWVGAVVNGLFVTFFSACTACVGILV